ncbi:MAG TPA: MotA/TolQ/ExbB proton channel family protein [Aquabacterium sp.]|nr:MotA/TolQ/ExbB proton channel family protein [Aquabacterium sp.]
MTDHPYGFVALWSQGDMVIKGVALALLLMSTLSWYVILTRVWRAAELRRATTALNGFWHTQSFAEGITLLEAHSAFSPYTHLAQEGWAAVEHHNSSQSDLHGQISLADWLTESLRGAIDESAERMQSGLAILASVGSTAPFVGLFGTVWGIYHALVSLGSAGQVGIDKVAGPVGEALIMTAFGLAVAIPAVLAYNTLTRSNKGVVNRLHRFARQLHAYFLTGSPLQMDGLRRKGS